MLIDDIVDFTNDTFKIKKEDAFTDQNENKEVSRHYASFDNRVSQNTPSVNNDSVLKIMQTKIDLRLLCFFAFLRFLRIF